MRIVGGASDSAGRVRHVGGAPWDLMTHAVTRSRTTASASLGPSCCPGWPPETETPPLWAGQWRCRAGSFSPSWVSAKVRGVARAPLLDELTPLRASSVDGGCRVGGTGSRYFPCCCTCVDYDCWLPVDGSSQHATVLSSETGRPNRKELMREGKDAYRLLFGWSSSCVGPPLQGPRCLFVHSHAFLQVLLWIVSGVQSGVGGCCVDCTPVRLFVRSPFDFAGAEGARLVVSRGRTRRRVKCWVLWVEDSHWNRACLERLGCLWNRGLWSRWSRTLLLAAGESRHLRHLKNRIWELSKTLFKTVFYFFCYVIFYLCFPNWGLQPPHFDGL